jgi:hypothetical protein
LVHSCRGNRAVAGVPQIEVRAAYLDSLPSVHAHRLSGQRSWRVPDSSHDVRHRRPISTERDVLFLTIPVHCRE